MSFKATRFLKDYGLEKYTKALERANLDYIWDYGMDDLTVDCLMQMVQSNLILDEKKELMLMEEQDNTFRNSKHQWQLFLSNVKQELDNQEQEREKKKQQREQWQRYHKYQHMKFMKAMDLKELLLKINSTCI